MGKRRKKGVIKDVGSSDDDMDEDFQDEAFWNKDGSYEIQRKKKTFRAQTEEERIYGVWANKREQPPSMRPRKNDSHLMSTLGMNFVQGERLDLKKEQAEAGLNETKGNEADSGTKSAPDAQRPGLGATAGLGHAGAGRVGFKLGAKTTQPQDPFGLESMLPKEFGQKTRKAEERFKKRQAEANAAKAGGGERKAAPVKRSKNFAKWEQHTKGIGMRLLEKMGFKGRLGKQESGRSEPILAFKRKKGIGIGFDGPEKVDRSSINPEDEAARERREIAQKEKEQELKRKKMYQRQPGTKRKRKYITAAEALKREGERRAGPKKIDQITDFTGPGGPQVKSISGISQASESWQPTAQEFIACPQFLHNVRLMTDLCAHEMGEIEDKLEVKRRRLKGLQDKLATATSRETRTEETLRRLREVAAIVDRMYPPTVNDDRVDGPMMSAAVKRSQRFTSPLPLHELSRLFETLQNKYHREYQTFGLASLAVSLIFPNIKSQFETWNPFETPDLPKMILKQWEPVLSTGAGRSPRGGRGPGPRSPVTSGGDLYSRLVNDVIVNRVRTAMVNLWQVHQPQVAVILFKSIKEVVPPHTYENLLAELVVPKLRQATVEWTPNGKAPTMLFLLPWISILQEHLAPIYPIVRRQISRSLVRWRVNDPFAIHLIAPWSKILPPEEINSLYFKTVCPRLESALEKVFMGKKPTTWDPFEEVMKWESLVPHGAFITIMQRGFFPSWLAELHKWIKKPDVDHAAVADWYEG